MKNIYIILFTGMVLLASSCKKDPNDFDLKDPEQIAVEGFEDSYTVVSEKDRLIINPKATSNENEADFDYAWWVYETNVSGRIPKIDTIARTKNLDYFVQLPAQGWALVYRVTNKKTKYAKHFSATLNVVTEFTRGWYVLKDDGTQSDLDLFLTPESIVPTVLKENVYSLMNGHKVDGKGKMINFFTSYKSMATGTLGNTKTLFMTTEKDVSAIAISTLKEIRNMNNLFIGTPSVIKPSAAVSASSAYLLVNDGELHNISVMSANDGRFGAAVLKDVSNTPYKLSDYYLTSTYSDAYFFDELSSSFVSLVNGSGTVLTDISDIDGTAMPAQKNNKIPLYMGFKSSTYLPAPEYRYAISGFAIFQDKSNSNLKIVSELLPDRTKMKMVNDTLKTTDKLFNGTLYTILDGDENMMYFVVGSEVWSRNLSNKYEQLQYTVPAGETVTFIRHKKFTEAAYTFNYVMVGTQSGGNYKVRMFTKSSGNLSTTPFFTLEGKGIVRDVMYMSPSVAERSYSNNY